MLIEPEPATVALEDAVAAHGTLDAATFGMPKFRIVFALAMLTLPAGASAQAWSEAYTSGDYAKAADLLHPLVIQLATQPGGPQDPEPPRHLATMYSEGRGVARDPIAACSISMLAQQAMVSPTATFGLESPAYGQRIEEANTFLANHCDHLSEWDRIIASNWCFAFGMPETVLTIGTDAVRVGRGGVHVADAMPERPDQIVGCPMRIARLRPLTITPPADAAPEVVARHFVDLLFWRPFFKPGDSPRFVLQWEMFEVQEHAIKMVLMQEQLDTIDGWPVPPMPKDFDAKLSVQMIRSGNIQWKLDGAPPKRGWIMLREDGSQ